MPGDHTGPYLRDMPTKEPIVTTRAAAPTKKSGWWVQVALLGLFVIPIVAGTSRLVELSGGPAILPANPRVDASPLPVIVHIVSAILYAVLGAFQFSSGFVVATPAGTAPPDASSWSWDWRGALGALDDPVLRAVRSTRVTCSTCSGSPSAPAWQPASCSASQQSGGATSPATEHG